MNIFFPQWQGSGTGISIKDGAKTVFDYIKDDIVSIPLSEKPLELQQNINGHSTLLEQLNRFKDFLVKEQPKTLHTIGGDCGLEIVPVSYLAEKHENLGVIWFDAHADINLPEESQSHNFHGMPLRTLLGEGNDELKDLLFTQITPSQIHYIGLRSIDAAEQDRINKDHIYAPLTLDISHLIKTLKEKNITTLYVHFDVDCLDPNSYKSAYFNVNNGITTNEAEHYLRELKANFKVVGTSILESVAMDEDQLQPIKKIIDLLFNE
ncbi:arginase family protein [Winogradskyella immobilis]|uniref:Arginase family protein n=1 Tax=Winogradskyella immobilis TaxID=2816852 RepID=A0ABS8EP71_9FLAO|nr:arginase family protein [Winogradskyella immobilis]MCC1484999.1 arginase family protein [Winogradskyella immobilis]MCG0017091.1 arginase family protein [Winogradskyella immobilis]